MVLVLIDAIVHDVHILFRVSDDAVKVASHYFHYRSLLFLRFGSFESGLKFTSEEFFGKSSDVGLV
jgi:hypothetical protein